MKAAGELTPAPGMAKPTAKCGGAGRCEAEPLSLPRRTGLILLSPQLSALHPTHITPHSSSRKTPSPHYFQATEDEN